MELKGKTVLITGASSGIGKAAALAFAKEGAQVVLAARRKERLEELKAKIENDGGAALAWPVDITSEMDIAKLFDAAEEKFGSVDILINNAGAGLESELVDIELEEWRKVFNVNCEAVFLCSREAARRLIDKKQPGHIITVASIAGKFGAPKFSAYCSSKHAVCGFVKSLKWELRKNRIKVSAIHPGRINTEFFDQYEKRPDSGQMLMPQDIADVLIAIAQRSKIKTILYLLRNFGKRIITVINMLLKK